MSPRVNIASRYFSAFHAGKVDETLSYFATNGTVSYKNEPPRAAELFFVETKEMIAQLSFTTHGVFESASSSDILIHFSFTMPSESGSPIEVEAVDIIEFDDADNIISVRVITNA